MIGFYTSPRKDVWRQPLSFSRREESLSCKIRNDYRPDKYLGTHVATLVSFVHLWLVLKFQNHRSRARKEGITISKATSLRKALNVVSETTCFPSASHNSALGHKEDLSIPTIERTSTIPALSPLPRLSSSPSSSHPSPTSSTESLPSLSYYTDDSSSAACSPSLTISSESYRDNIIIPSLRIYQPVSGGLDLHLARSPHKSYVPPTPRLSGLSTDSSRGPLDIAFGLDSLAYASYSDSRINDDGFLSSPDLSYITPPTFSNSLSDCDTVVDSDSENEAENRHKVRHNLIYVEYAYNIYLNRHLCHGHPHPLR